MLIIGDVHGAYQTLLALLAKCPPGEKLCFVGDLIDRGPDSRSVVQFVIDGKHDCLMGNHEDIALFCNGWPHQIANRSSIYDPFVWARNGGLKCAASYPDGKMSPEHLEFLSKLPLVREYPDLVDDRGRRLIVSHAGICEGKSLAWAIDALRSTDEHEFDASILWWRYTPEVIPGTFHVYGHTPHYDKVIEENYANVDTGCGRRQKLTALRFPQMELYEQEYIG